MVSSLLLAGMLAVANVANVVALELDVKNKDSIKSAAKTIVEDMVKKYYPSNSTIGLIQSEYEEEDPYSPKESAMFWDSLLNYWFLTGDDQYNDMVSKAILGRVGENVDFFPRDLWARSDNEDQVAWALTCLAAAEREFPNPPSGQPQWLNLSKTIFDIQASRWDTQECDGGIRVNPYAAYNGDGYYYKHPGSWFLLLAARLGAFTGNQTYFDWAEKEYSWAAGTPGLVTSDFAVYYGLPLTGGHCNSPVNFEYTFNQAAFLYGSAVAYNATSSDVWRKRVEGHLERFSTFFVKESDNVNATDSAGGDILTEQTCAKVTTLCSRDERYYKSLAARWMSQAAVSAPFIADKVGSFLQGSAANAAKTCTGTDTGKLCGFWWETGKYAGAGKYAGGGELAEEIGALEIIQQNLNGPHLKLATVNSTISNPSVTPSSSVPAPTGTGTGTSTSSPSQGNNPSSTTGANAAARLATNAWVVIALPALSQLF
ncbi:glycoside hydrolase [Thozetella sp. PMI_491]|nr:glycoside hydrolase [Thozetella sp. PMI_491]